MNVFQSNAMLELQGFPLVPILPIGTEVNGAVWLLLPLPFEF
jgi:hypothetical protein